MGLPQDVTIAPLLDEFEPDMGSLAEGLRHLYVGHRETYPRLDIYLDQD